MVFSIFFITAVGLVFLILTVFKRLKRIRKEGRRIRYQQKAEDFIFGFLFSDRTIEDVLQSEEFQQLVKSRLFRVVAVKALVSLEYNYKGAYGEKLGRFYRESGLIDYSLRQLNSGKWPEVIEGIRDLSTMNSSKAYPKIAALITHKNPLVKTEVLLALIKMKGITEILKFENFDLFLNDWVQSNILYVVKSNRIAAPADLPKLLNSRNSSIVLLTIRLMGYYDGEEFRRILSDYRQHCSDVKIKSEIDRIQRTQLLIA